MTPQPAMITRVLPFALFMVFLALDEPLGSALAQLGLEARWSYLFRSGAAAMCLLCFWRSYGELRKAEPPRLMAWLVAVAVGLGVFVLWILPYPGWAMQGGSVRGAPPADAQGAIDWGWIALRMLAASLVVPAMEELFWRSFLMRWMDYSAFTSVQPSAIRLRSVLIVSGLFATTHDLWVAGFIAGLCYAILYRKYGNLWLAIFAHGVTNLALAGWVLATSSWQYW